MNPATQGTAELEILRTLCDENVSREQQQNLLESYSLQFFTDPEHQVVFESIRRVFDRGLISIPRLAAHLNNRGFPDIDLGRYFPTKDANRMVHQKADNE